MNHTPEPWIYGRDESSGFYLEKLGGSARIGYVFGHADASHVVTCVNSHPQLLALLERWVEQSEGYEDLGLITETSEVIQALR
jgi:hypothetical protein